MWSKKRSDSMYSAVLAHRIAPKCFASVVLCVGDILCHHSFETSLSFNLTLFSALASNFLLLS